MIVGLLPPRISADLSLVSGFLTWVTVLVWLWRSGWRIQRRYFVEATQTPLTRNAIVWVAALVGAVSFVAAQMRPGIPAVLVVSMVGALSAYVDARTHRLPNAYTLVMGIGVAAGIVIGAVISGGITYAMYVPMCHKLKEHLSKLEFASPESFAVEVEVEDATLES